MFFGVIVVIVVTLPPAIVFCILLYPKIYKNQNPTLFSYSLDLLSIQCLTTVLPS